MSKQKKQNNRKRLVILFLLLPLVIAVAWNAFLRVSRCAEERCGELCDNLYSEAYNHQYNSTELKRLRELSDEEIDALISDLRNQDTNRIEQHKFAYKRCWPYNRWNYDNDMWFDRDEVVSCLEDIRKPNNQEEDTIMLQRKAIRAYYITDVRCHHCHGKNVVLFEYCSPLWTWQNLCGREGPVMYCTHCKRILCYRWYAIN